MTDRELLDLAAKAAGLTIHKRHQAGRDACGAGDVGLWISNGMTCWNPLTDDGDALRLAVFLNLTVRVGSATTPSFGAVDVGLLRKKQDANAATRRAIVLAAAMIGKAIP